MDKNLADFVARVAFKNASEFSKLIPLLTDNLEENEAKIFTTNIKKITELITTEVLFKIYDEHPGIHNDFKRTIEAYGKLP